MATSTTFKGAPKPYGATGHFDEPRRHSLQAKGIKTGHLSDNAVYEQYGITNLEKNAKAQDVPMTSEGLEDVQAEAIEEKAEQPKKVSFVEKVKNLERSFADSLKRERELHKHLKQERLYSDLGKEMPVPKTDEADQDEEDDDYDSDSAPAKFAHLIVNLDGDYSSEDLVNINDNELELLAVRFKTQNKDSLSPFGEPSNPFVEELKRRIQARDELAKEKAEVREEIRHPKKKEGLFDDLF